jgi:hypothetical protein
MAFRKKNAESNSPLAGLLDALIPLTEDQFINLVETARQARGLKDQMNELRAALG